MRFSSKTWLSGVALSSLLLAGSLPTATAASQPSAVSAQRLHSVQISTGDYAKVVHKDLKWVPLEQVKPVSTEAKKEVVVANASSASSQAMPAEKKPAVAKRPVQVAQVPSQQASRGSSDSSSLVSRALSLQGIPYVFGGTSRNGFDCSGFTQYVFKASGVSLPRTSFAQFEAGSSVSKDQLQPGDLVFFNTYAAGASHVGIYVGGGRFVHASDNGVTTTSLSESYYANRYRGARRVR